MTKNAPLGPGVELAYWILENHTSDVLCEFKGLSQYKQIFQTI